MNRAWKIWLLSSHPSGPLVRWSQRQRDASVEWSLWSHPQQHSRAQMQLDQRHEAPHLVLFDELQVAMEAPLLRALRAHPEIKKVLFVRELQAEIVSMSVQLSGLDGIVDESSHLEALLELMRGMSHCWSEDGQRPLRWQEAAVEEELRMLREENEALAQANIRSIESMEGLEAPEPWTGECLESWGGWVAALFGEEGELGSGSLSEYPLFELLALLHLSKRSLRMSLVHRATQATLAFWEGELIYAATDGELGIEALSQVMSWGWGEFFLHPMESPLGWNLQISTREYLMEYKAKRKSATYELDVERERMGTW